MSSANRSSPILTVLYLVVIALAVLVALGGCANLPQGATNPDVAAGDGGAPVGSYSYTVAPDGTVKVDSRTLRGGPDVEVTTKDGATVKVHSSNKQILGDVLKVLIP